jgi:hypothetical protein
MAGLPARKACNPGSNLVPAFLFVLVSALLVALAAVDYSEAISV